MSKFSNQKNYNCRVTLDNNEEYLVFSNWLSNEDNHHFKGWNCDAGRTRFFIDSDFNVFSCESGRNDHLGTVDNFEILEKGTTCNLDICANCTDDLATYKFKD